MMEHKDKNLPSPYFTIAFSLKQMVNGDFANKDFEERRKGTLGKYGNPTKMRILISQYIHKQVDGWDPSCK